MGDQDSKDATLARLTGFVRGAIHRCNSSRPSSLGGRHRGTGASPTLPTPPVPAMRRERVKIPPAERGGGHGQRSRAGLGGQGSRGRDALRAIGRTLRRPPHAGGQPRGAGGARNRADTPGPFAREAGPGRARPRGRAGWRRLTHRPRSCHARSHPPRLPDALHARAAPRRSHVDKPVVTRSFYRPGHPVYADGAASQEGPAPCPFPRPQPPRRPCP